MMWVQQYRIVSTTLIVLFYTLLLGGIFLLIGWYIEAPPAEIVERTVIMEHVKAGDFLQIRNILRWTKECPVYVERMVTDSDGVVRNYQPADVYKAVHGVEMETVVAEIHIPGAAAKGIARYNSTFIWSCNPLQRVWPRRLKLPELRFTIT